MSSHNILNSRVFLGRDLIKLIIFKLSSKTSFQDGGIFFFFHSKGLAVEDAVATVALLDFLFYSRDAFLMPEYRVIVADSASGSTGLTCVSLASIANCSLGTPATNSPIISSTSDRPNTGTSYSTAPREIRINVNKPTNGRLPALQARLAKPSK